LRVATIEPWHHPRRQIATGGLHYPDLTQRHQASFGLGALFALVAHFELASGLFRPVPRIRYWPISIPLLERWSLLIFTVAPFVMRPRNSLRVSDAPLSLSLFRTESYQLLGILGKRGRSRSIKRRSYQ